MDCRSDCGACCIAPSISSPLPGLPDGKAAGVRCPHLDESYACDLWGDPRRPRVCAQFKPEPDICGSSRQDALQVLAVMEEVTHV
ncbi:MAG: YkgJ family cysteine cluster protein [Pseudomonadaceae bacterium]|nr:YkgJ family cysteine cluster protein [Pseudomonadaceae bacterium]